MEELGTRSVGIFKRVEEFGTIKELGRRVRNYRSWEL